MFLGTYTFREKIGASEEPLLLPAGRIHSIAETARIFRSSVRYVVPKRNSDNNWTWPERYTLRSFRRPVAEGLGPCPSKRFRVSLRPRQASFEQFFEGAAGARFAKGDCAPLSD